MKVIRLFLFILMPVLFLLASTPGETQAVPAQQANLLNNPSFEDPYESGAASGWGRWHRDTGAASKPDNCSDSYAFQPKWSRETNGDLVQDGSISQHIGNQFDTWHGGVMQTVDVTPGSTYRFSFVATGRATNEQYPAPSDGSVNLGVRAGIDPNGSGLWSDSDVVWGGAGSPHMGGASGNWQEFTVEATATGSQITVFTSANLAGANQCRGHLDVWFDRAQLVEAGPPPTNTPPPQPTLPPPPPVTNTAVPPTATATPEVTPTNTPLPTATATNTPEPGGTICVNAFADQNSNGLHEETEGAMAGVTFTVAQEGVVVGQGVAAGPEPVCFSDLDPGNYQVAQTVPATLEMTTGANAAVDVDRGQMVMIEFGSRVRPEPQDVTSDEVASADTVETGSSLGAETGDSVEAAGEDGSFSIAAVSGLAALFLAITLLGVLIFLLVRQRA